MLNLLAIRALQVLRRRDLMRSCEEGMKIATHGEPHFRKEGNSRLERFNKNKNKLDGTEK